MTSCDFFFLNSTIRALVQQRAAKTAFNLFVSNLGLADLLMGLYIAIIGTADVIYRGRYLYHDRQWMDSVACKVKIVNTIELTCLEDSLRSVRKSLQTWRNALFLRPCYTGLVKL
jgi:hypothetical protein